MTLPVLPGREKIIISLDGNIGVGKSTLIQHLKTHIPNIHIIPEPVDTWTTYKTAENKNLLELFYEDKERWAYTFQNCAVITRALTIVDTIAKTPNKDVFITERSLLTDRNVFAEMLHNNGCINELEWKLYNKWYDTFSDWVSISGIIYITTSPETAETRLHIRAREGEDTITLKYLYGLDIQHRKWISETHIPVLKISTESDTNVCDNIKKIERFIETLLKPVL